jgi:hypothetical protein
MPACSSGVIGNMDYLEEAIMQRMQMVTGKAAARVETAAL